MHSSFQIDVALSPIHAADADATRLSSLVAYSRCVPIPNSQLVGASSVAFCVAKFVETRRDSRRLSEFNTHRRRDSTRQLLSRMGVGGVYWAITSYS